VTAGSDNSDVPCRRRAPRYAIRLDGDAERTTWFPAAPEKCVDGEAVTPSRPSLAEPLLACSMVVTVVNHQRMETEAPEVRQYLGAMNEIEKKTAQAINEFNTHLRETWAAAPATRVQMAPVNDAHSMGVKLACRLLRTPGALPVKAS
jgi:hypothetical protein